jgi:transposase
MVLICDNVPFHKSEEIVEYVARNGHVLIFLPPYSPQLNPIDKAFSAWKEGIRSRNCQNKEELFNAIRTESNRISSESCQGFFSI